jgi:UDP-2,3-diacylglucosamine hydrolase
VSGQPDSLGIVAGARSLPLELARHARAAGVKRLVALAFEGETDPALAGLVDEIVWVRLGQLSKSIAAFTSRGVKQVVMSGKFEIKHLFSVRPDLRAVTALLRLREKNLHTLIGGLVAEMEKDGLEVVSAVRWFGPLMPGAGFLLGPKLNATQRADVELGYRMAKEISRLEIGQTVVVKEGSVLAVEGFEGTDACLARGGELAGKSGGAVAVKVAKENHDMRFDIPTIGLRTVETSAQHGIAVLAFEPGSTLLMDQAEIAVLARKKKISVTTTTV